MNNDMNSKNSKKTPQEEVKDILKELEDLNKRIPIKPKSTKP